MKTSGTKTSFLTAALTTLLLASPLVFANHHGEKSEHRGHPDICEKYEQHQGKAHYAKREERMEKRFEWMAERLNLSAGQRETWDQMHAEMKAERAEKKAQWHEKMQARCEGDNE
ncbi:hypothetical protein [Marinobacter caseinilyticus]|uniref:hypothetical protein n=1 Tax=Marinobacter caseinilyticus TaxID=2692195 RepID=UPI00140736B0|nr:hypothetical protein [Marinobacter caseinilyticus]